VGANIDSITTAKSFGINTANVMQFSGDSNSNTKVYQTISRAMKSRGASLAGGSYSSEKFVADEDKDLTSK
jgi:hypothetical protein